MIDTDVDDLEAGEDAVEEGGALARTDPDRPFERTRRRHEQSNIARAMNLGAAPDLHHQERRIICFLIEQQDYSWAVGGTNSKGRRNMSQRQWAKHLRMPEGSLRLAVDELTGLDVLVRWPRKEDMDPHAKRGTVTIHIALSDAFVDYLWHWERTWNPRLGRNMAKAHRHGSTMVRDGLDLHAEMAEIHPDHWMELPPRGRRWTAV